MDTFTLWRSQSMDELGYIKEVYLCTNVTPRVSFLSVHSGVARCESWEQNTIISPDLRKQSVKLNVIQKFKKLLSTRHLTKKLFKTRFLPTILFLQSSPCTLTINFLKSLIVWKKRISRNDSDKFPVNDRLTTESDIHKFLLQDSTLEVSSRLLTKPEDPENHRARQLIRGKKPIPTKPQWPTQWCDQNLMKTNLCRLWKRILCARMRNAAPEVDWRGLIKRWLSFVVADSPD